MTETKPRDRATLKSTSCRVSTVGNLPSVHTFSYSLPPPNSHTHGDKDPWSWLRPPIRSLHIIACTHKHTHTRRNHARLMSTDSISSTYVLYDIMSCNQMLLQAVNKRTKNTHIKAVMWNMMHTPTHTNTSHMTPLQPTDAGTAKSVSTLCSW